MNLAFFINAHPNVLCSMWHWKPRYRRFGWPLERGGGVWYVHIDWLCFGLQLDNEW
jgi:hypothetical protein